MQILVSLVHDARWQPAWRALLLVLMSVAAWFAFIPVEINASPSGMDKVEHAVAFAAMGLAAFFTGDTGLRRVAGAAAGLLLYGAFIELVQTQLPTRQASWADFLADGVGAAVGLALAAWMRRRLRR